MTEDQVVKEYKDGDAVHLTVEVSDEEGIAEVSATAVHEGENPDDISVLSSKACINLLSTPKEWTTQIEAVLTGEVFFHKPGLYYCYTIVTSNKLGHLGRKKLEQPLKLRVAESPEYAWRGPEVLSVGEFW